MLVAIISLQAASTGGEVNDKWSIVGSKNTLPHAVGVVILIAISVFMHVRGAYSHDASIWNVRPNNVDEHSERLWDWSHPQFLAGLITPEISRDFPVFKSGESIFLNDSAAEPYLISGWSGPEPNFRWTESNAARFGFKSSVGRAIAISLNMAPFVTASHDKQRLRIEANNKFVAEFVFGEQPMSEIRFVIPRSFVKEANLITLQIPDATSPKTLKISEDARNLGIAVESFTITGL